MSLDLCLKRLHVVHIKVFHRMQYYTAALVLLRHFPVLQIPVTPLIYLYQLHWSVQYQQLISMNNALPTIHNHL